LAKVMSDRPRYINLVVLLRIVCEISATVLLAQFFYRAVSREWGLFDRRGRHGGDQLRRHRRRSADTRPPERLLYCPGVSATAAGDFGVAGPDQPDLVSCSETC
jgi:hypothetical protein